MKISNEYYGLKKTTIEFTPYEIKEALIEYMFTHNKEYLPKKIDSCEIEIYEEIQEDDEYKVKGRSAYVELIINNKELEKKE